jgi:formylglycine-generating enzyme required for sulfatase activity
MGGFQMGNAGRDSEGPSEEEDSPEKPSEDARERDEVEPDAMTEDDATPEEADPPLGPEGEEKPRKKKKKKRKKKKSLEGISLRASPKTTEVDKKASASIPTWLIATGLGCLGMGAIGLVVVVVLVFSAILADDPEDSESTSSSSPESSSGADPRDDDAVNRDPSGQDTPSDTPEPGGEDAPGEHDPSSTPATPPPDAHKPRDVERPGGDDEAKGPDRPGEDPLKPPDRPRKKISISILEPIAGLIISETQLKIRGKADDPEAVVRVNGVEAKMSGPGTFQARVEGLKEGRNRIRIAASTPDGGRGETVVEVTVDVTPPRISVPGLGDEEDLYVRDSALSLTGKLGEDGIETVEVNGSAVAVTDRSFTLSLTLKDGKNVVVLKARDAVGNVTEIRRTVVLDTEDPTVQITAPKDGSMHGKKHIEVMGVVDDASISYVVINGRRVNVSDRGFRAMIVLAEGAGSIDVSAKDSAGNSAKATVSVSVDLTPPLLTLTAPKTGLVTRNKTLVIQGTVDDPTVGEVTVGGSRAGVHDGAFQVEIKLKEGSNPTVVGATDGAGNHSEVKLEVTLDTIPPALTQTQPQNKAVVLRETVLFKGLCSEPVSKVMVNRTAVPCRDKGFEIKLTLEEGENRVEIRLKDLAGNESTLEIVLVRKREEEVATKGMALVPETRLVLGDQDGDFIEKGGTETFVPAFLCDRREVTNREYSAFLVWARTPRLGDKTRHRFSHPMSPPGKDHTPSHWLDRRYNRPEQPVVGVDWFDAYAYAAWRGRRLPTEAEWAVAASWDPKTKARAKFPWGTAWDASKGNFDRRVGAAAAVESYPGDVSALGVFDMAGNVQEWCADWFRGPHSRDAFTAKKHPQKYTNRFRIIKGGSFLHNYPRFARCAYRHFQSPLYRAVDLGFRTVKKP